MQLQQLHTPVSEKVSNKLFVSYAQSADAKCNKRNVCASRVFTGEMGASISGGQTGIDSDIYDTYCDHLLVRDAASSEVVGTYRLLPGLQARQIGSFYADAEFDLTRLNHLRDATVEIGRACVHPDYRNGATIVRLWAGLVAYAARRGYQYLMGCASLSMIDGGHVAANIYRRLASTHLAPAEYRVFPRCELPLATLDREIDVVPPPLVKGYVRIGAYVCGEPSWDADFNTADLLMLLPLSRMDARYARHFLSN